MSTLQALQKQLQDMSTENVALRNELEAFDPEFFEEIEELKSDRILLEKKLHRYGATIQQLASELSITADLS